MKLNYNINQVLEELEWLKTKKTERYVLLFLKNNKIKECLDITDKSELALCTPYSFDVMSYCKEKGYNQIIQVHNHPRNTMKPSDEDVKGTGGLLVEFGETEVKLLDCLIICKDGYYSHKENNWKGIRKIIVQRFA